MRRPTHKRMHDQKKTKEQEKNWKFQTKKTNWKRRTQGERMRRTTPTTATTRKRYTEIYLFECKSLDSIYLKWLTFCVCWSVRRSTGKFIWLRRCCKHAHITILALRLNRTQKNTFNRRTNTDERTYRTNGSRARETSDNIQSETVFGRWNIPYVNFRREFFH